MTEYEEQIADLRQRALALKGGRFEADTERLLDVIDELIAIKPPEPEEPMRTGDLPDVCVWEKPVDRKIIFFVRQTRVVVEYTDGTYKCRKLLKLYATNIKRYMVISN